MIKAAVGHNFEQAPKVRGRIVNLNVMEQVLYETFPQLILNDLIGNNVADRYVAEATRRLRRLTREYVITDFNVVPWPDLTVDVTVRLVYVPDKYFRYTYVLREE